MDKKITCNEGTIWNAKQIAGYIRENGRLIGRTSMINTERSQREIEMIEEYAKEYHQSKLQALKEDLKNSRKRWAEWSNAFPATSYRTHEADGAIKEIDRILKSDLITSLEDNG